MSEDTTEVEVCDLECNNKVYSIYTLLHGNIHELTFLLNNPLHKSYTDFTIEDKAKTILNMASIHVYLLFTVVFTILMLLFESDNFSEWACIAAVLTIYQIISSYIGLKKVASLLYDNTK